MIKLSAEFYSSLSSEIKLQQASPIQFEFWDWRLRRYYDVVYDLGSSRLILIIDGRMVSADFDSSKLELWMQIS